VLKEGACALLVITKTRPEIINNNLFISIYEFELK